MTATTHNTHSRWPLWGLLVFCGVISLTLSVMHALSRAAAGDVEGMIAGFIVGVAPVVAAALLAHLLTDPYAARALKFGVGLVFLGGMALSVNAQKAVVLPFVDGNHFLAILFPIVIDLSTVMALLALSGVGYSLNKAIQMEEIRAELLPAIAEELEQKFRAEQATREARLREELGRKKNAEIAAHATELRTELAAAHSMELRELQENHGREIAELSEAHSEELTAREQKLREEFTDLWQKAEDEIRRQAQAETKTLVRDAEIATEARVRLELTQSGTPSKRTPKAIGRGPKNDGGPQVNKRDRAASILRTTPDIEVKDLAAMLDCTPKYARDLIKDLAPGRGNGQDETGGEEVRLHAVP